jgi:hypothetical protein
MSVRTMAFQAPVAKRVTMPRPASIKATPLRASRPAQLQSEFLSPVASLKGLCASFTREYARDWTTERHGDGGKEAAVEAQCPWRPLYHIIMRHRFI